MSAVATGGFKADTAELAVSLCPLLHLLARS